MCGFVCLLAGGPDLLMNIGGKSVLFELHPYMGPIPISKKDGSELRSIPIGFWDSFERWELGGKRLDGTTCIVPSWCAQCSGSGERIRGRQIIGRCQVCHGKKVN